MGMCAHDPIPISVLDKFLEKNVGELTSVRECPLLLKNPEEGHQVIDDFDQIPRIYAHFSTLTHFRELLSKYLSYMP